MAVALAERDQARAEVARMARSKFWRLGLLYWQTRARLLGRLGRLAQRGGVPRRTAPAAATPLAREAPRPVPATPPAATEPAPRTLPDIICFSIIDWAFRYQRPQQLMARFAAHGHRVFYISLAQPLPVTAAPSFALRRLAENVYELSLPAAGGLDVYSAVIGPGQHATLLAGLESLRETFGICDALAYVMMASWGPLALEARQRWGWRVVYDCMDEWGGFPGIGRAVVDMEAPLVAASDLLVVTAQALYDKWQPRGPRLVLARNAVDYDFYAERLLPNGQLLGTPHPVAGYFGALAEWFDVELLRCAAEQRPEVTFVLIGGVFDVDISSLAALPNVKLLGPRPYAAMPGYLYNFDVCLIPFKLNAITHATDPVKLYEYFSAGKPVVATHLAELAPHRAHVYLAAGASDFVAQLDAALAERDPQRAAARQALARQNTWEHRYQAIVAALPPAAETDGHA